MSLLRKSKRYICALVTGALLTINATPLYAFNYNKFENINIEMPSVIAIDEISGDVLYAQNENEQRPIASLTKTMTLLLILDAIKKGEISPDDMIELKEDPDSWGSSFYLKKGDKFPVKDFLQMIMIISANDACVVMAEKVSGSVENFVKSMNLRAKELGMNDTVFYNPNGLPLSRESNAEPGNLSTAKDLATLTKYIMNVYGDEIIKLVSSKSLDLECSDVVRPNSNKLLRRQETFDGFVVDGFKTGYTVKAGYCLIATSEHNNKTPEDKEDDYRVISVTLGGENGEHRFTQHTRLLNYVQNTYVNKKILSKEEVIDTIDKYNMEKYKINVVPKEDVYALVRADSEDSFTNKVTLKENIAYPVYKDDSIGVLTLTNKNNTNLTYSVDLVSANDTSEVSIFDRIFKGVK